MDYPSDVRKALARRAVNPNAYRVDRRQRYDLAEENEPQVSLTAIIMGDPPPGRSPLDQKLRA